MFFNTRRELSVYPSYELLLLTINNTFTYTIAYEVGKKTQNNGICLNIIIIYKDMLLSNHNLVGDLFFNIIQDKLITSGAWKSFITQCWKYSHCRQTEKILVSRETDRGLDIMSSHFCRLVDSDTFWRGSCSEIRPTPSQKLQRVMQAMLYLDQQIKCAIHSLYF